MLYKCYGYSDSFIIVIFALFVYIVNMHNFKLSKNIDYFANKVGNNINMILPEKVRYWISTNVKSLLNLNFNLF